MIRGSNFIDIKRAAERSASIPIFLRLLALLLPAGVRATRSRIAGGALLNRRVRPAATDR